MAHTFKGLEDTVQILTAETGPKAFRTHTSYARMAVSQSGTLKSWTGTGWDAGTLFTESQAITCPGYYQITLDSSGEATIQESSI